MLVFQEPDLLLRTLRKSIDNTCVFQLAKLSITPLLCRICWLLFNGNFLYCLMAIVHQIMFISRLLFWETPALELFFEITIFSGVLVAI
jgi:hypothetical protein